MLRVPGTVGQSMFHHIFSDMVNHQKNGLSFLRVSACYPQLSLRPVSTQRDIPRHPVPPLKDTLTKFVSSVDEDEVFCDFMLLGMSDCVNQQMVTDVSEEYIASLFSIRQHNKDDFLDSLTLKLEELCSSEMLVTVCRLT